VPRIESFLLLFFSEIAGGVVLLMSERVKEKNEKEKFDRNRDETRENNTKLPAERK